MALKFRSTPVRCLFSLILIFLLAVPEMQQAAFAQAPGGKLNLIIVEGEGAINNVRQRTAREPIVQVQDENNRPVAGAAVVFLLPESGPGGTFAGAARSLKVITDNQGRAIAKGLRLNDVAGKFQIKVEASYKGMTATTSINQSNAVLTAASTGGGLSGKMIALLVAIGAAAAAGIVIATRGDDPVATSPNSPTGGR